jgi:hypothetical protein
LLRERGRMQNGEWRRAEGGKGRMEGRRGRRGQGDKEKGY